MTAVRKKSANDSNRVPLWMLTAALAGIAALSGSAWIDVRSRLAAIEVHTASVERELGVLQGKVDWIKDWTTSKGSR